MSACHRYYTYSRKGCGFWQGIFEALWRHCDLSRSVLEPCACLMCLQPEPQRGLADLESDWNVVAILILIFGVSAARKDHATGQHGAKQFPPGIDMDRLTQGLFGLYCLSRDSIHHDTTIRCLHPRVRQTLWVLPTRLFHTAIDHDRYE